MAHDEQLVERVRTILAGRRGVSEKPLMGTLAFLVNGTVCCSVVAGSGGRSGSSVALPAPQRGRGESSRRKFEDGWAASELALRHLEELER